MSLLKILVYLFGKRSETPKKEVVNMEDKKESKTNGNQVITEDFNKENPKVAPISTQPEGNSSTKHESSEAISKTQIYNLIIVDESGSMDSLKDVTVSGINETISTIRNAQKEFEETQEHFLTLVTFDERNCSDIPAVRTIFDTIPISDVEKFSDYHPNGCTPLYDAIGISLSKLKEKIHENENATGVVTVLTDGLENASHLWRVTDLRRLIKQLKEEGWVFSYMGSAHNVKDVTDLLSIENVMEFSHDNRGASNTWTRESSSRQAYYCKMNDAYIQRFSMKDIKRRYAKEYYNSRVTPEHIDFLQPDQIFVFGSDPDGHHESGTAAFAMQNFGAVNGQSEGIQGQSYAIPITQNKTSIEESVHRFCIYALNHTDKQFLVTKVGYNINDYNEEDIALIFTETIKIENIYLPASYWKILGLTMF